MKIEYLGHSCFVLTFGAVKIVTDPFGSIGFSMPSIAADAVTVSHGHYDHCNVGAVSAKRVLSAAGQYEVGGVKIAARRRYHDEVKGRKRGEDLIFRFEAEGVSVLHMGDIGEPLSREVLDDVGRADILLLPVGGNYTIDGDEAARYAEAMAPKVVIPMHYYTEGLQVDIAGPQKFLAHFPAYERAKGELEFDKEMRGGRVILMERRK